jgi:hypothetical protein
MQGRMRFGGAFVMALATVALTLVTAAPAVGAGTTTTTAATTTTTPATTTPRVPVKTSKIGTLTQGFPESWGLTRHDLVLIGAGFLIMALLLVVLVLRVRRRRRGEVVSARQAPTHAFPVTAESWRGSGLTEEPTGKLPAFRASDVVIPPTAVSQGWHPVEGDPSRIAYWDGARWAAFRQWNGTQWLDPTAVGV